MAQARGHQEPTRACACLLGATLAPADAMGGSALLEREGAAVAALDVAAARGAGAARGGRACCAPCRVLHVWSGPRCLSTSCLYAFAQVRRALALVQEHPQSCALEHDSSRSSLAACRC